MYIKKFYDMDAPDSSGNSQATPEPQPVNSIAEAMARYGVKSDSEGNTRSIQLNSGSSESDRQEPASPVAPTKESSSSAHSEYDNPSSSQSEPAYEQKDSKAYNDYDLNTVLSKESPEAILKALGFDEKAASFVSELKELDPKLIGLVETWKQGGDLKSYLDEASKDFSAMSSEDVMRHQLRLEYPKATEAQLDVLFKKEIVEKYNLNSYDEDEQNEGKLLLDAKADKYREQLAEMQRNKLIPESSSYSEQQQAQQKAIMEYTNSVIQNFTDNQYTRDVMSNNAITIGEGADKFVFPVDAKELTNLIIHGDEEGDLMFEKKQGEDGKMQLVPKAEHQFLVAAINKYGNKFFTELAKHYKSLGSKAAIDPIDNARPVEARMTSSSSPEPTSIVGAMAKYGRLNSGG